MKKSYIEQLKDIYKALYNNRQTATQKDEVAGQCVTPLETVGSMYKFNALSAEDSVIRQYNALLDNLNASVLEHHMRHDFSQVFERYIHS